MFSSFMVTRIKLGMFYYELRIVGCKYCFIVLVTIPNSSFLILNSLCVL